VWSKDGKKLFYLDGSQKMTVVDVQTANDSVQIGAPFKHPARALQDRLVRRGRTDRTRQHAIPEWKKIYQTEAQDLHQARVLSWGKEKRYCDAHKHSV
jgi:hypothetical protein